MEAAGLNLRTILSMIVIIGLQAAGGGLLAKSDGFRIPSWTWLMLGTAVLQFYLWADLMRRGAPLSILVPIMAAAGPMLSILIGVFFLNESASVPRIASLIGACALISLASRL